MDPVVHSGEIALFFQLNDIDGRSFTLKDYRGWTVLLNYWSPVCPWAERTDQALGPLLSTWEEVVVPLWIASNANEAPDMLRKAGEARHLPMVLHDPDNRVADLYGALTTPHLYLIDGLGVLSYRGALDDVTFSQRLHDRASHPVGYHNS